MLGKGRRAVSLTAAGLIKPCSIAVTVIYTDTSLRHYKEQ